MAVLALRLVGTAEAAGDVVGDVGAQGHDVNNKDEGALKLYPDRA